MSADPYAYALPNKETPSYPTPGYNGVTTNFPVKSAQEYDRNEEIRLQIRLLELQTRAQQQQQQQQQGQQLSQQPLSPTAYQGQQLPSQQFPYPQNQFAVQYQQPQYSQYPPQQQQQSYQQSPVQQAVVVSPSTVAVTPMVVTADVCPVGGGSHVWSENYNPIAIFLAIFFFPLGILCCLAMREERCAKCNQSAAGVVNRGGTASYRRYYQGRWLVFWIFWVVIIVICIAVPVAIVNSSSSDNCNYYNDYCDD